MDINELTIGQAKELSSMFGNNAPTTKMSLYSRYVGKYVICRTRNEGINAGKVLALDETGVILEDARRLYYHKPASKSLSWYEGVAIDGLSNDSRVGAAVEKILAEDYSLTVCSVKGEKSIRGAKDNEQS
jgi:hypothetical protein